MTDKSNGNSNSSVGIVAILAMLVLVGVAAWFVWGRSGNAPTTAKATSERKADVTVKVDLPDTVTIRR